MDAQDPDRQGAAAALASGFASDAQRAVLSTLSDDEIALLLAIQDRVRAAAPEVEGHILGVGSTFW